MRHILRQKVLEAIDRARTQGELTSSDLPNGLTVEVPKQESHGDWSTNAALVMAKSEKMAPRKISDIIMKHLDDPEGYFEDVSVAGPGFINFTLSHQWWEHVVRDVLQRAENYGRIDLGQGRKIQVEFVSANPTGPLHVGHGRGAALGDALARVLDAAGWSVQREYYINDAGNQMQTLGRSVLYRMLEAEGRPVEFHDKLYQGDYIREIASRISPDDRARYIAMPEDETVDEIYPMAADEILQGIKKDLKDFGVEYDEWFSEKSLYKNGAVPAALEDLKSRGFSYEKDGAVWFKSTDFGDDKDRVLVRNNGETTYFASDIAYHRNKYVRGFDVVINLWGADHHGYVPRMKSAVQALGYDKSQLEILLVQLVSLLRGGEPVAMSTRGGEFVTLREVMDEVGTDVARYYFLTRSSDSHLDFDLETAVQRSNDNPVFYIQYAHARICSVFRTADESEIRIPDIKEVDLGLLVEKEEMSIIKHLAAFPDTVGGAASSLEPHRLTHYLLELAKKFHPYYFNHRFISDNLELTKARLVLADAVRQVTANGLTLLGISAPERM